MKRMKDGKFNEMVANYEKFKEDELEKFLKFCLVHASKCKNYSMVTEICTCLKNQNQEMINDVLHHKDEDKKTALFYANEKKQFKNGFDLISLEKKAHRGDRDEALRCIRKEAGYDQLDLWFIETYKLLHPPSKCTRRIEAFFAVLFFVLPSVISFFYDLVTDILLCIQYYYIAYGTSMQTKCSVQPSYETCFKEAFGNLSCIQVDQVATSMKKILTNETCLLSDEWSPCVEDNQESVNMKYEIAFVVNFISIFFSLLVYLGNIIRLKPDFSKIENKCVRKILEFCMKILWPLYYIIEEYRFRTAAMVEKEEKSAGNVNDTYERKERTAELTADDSWKLLRAVENGIENYVQMVLQIFLLLPYISFIISLPVSQILNLSLVNIINMFSWPESFCDKRDGYAALGKLTLTILVLSYGTSSRQTSKRGQTLGQSIKNLSLWVSFFCYSLARIMAIFSLLSLSNPLPFVITFIIVHIIFVLLIQAKLNEIKLDYTWNGTQLNKIWTQIKGLGLNLTSAIGSHTLWISIHSTKRGTPSFFKQLLFQTIIIFENLILLLLPVIVPHLYPPEECFQIHPSIIGYSFLFWSVGVALQVQHNLSLTILLILQIS